jgi:hypothetical protein
VEEWRQWTRDPRLPRLRELYAWSAHELGAPGLLDYAHDGALTYAWPYEDREVWLAKRSVTLGIVRRALPPLGARAHDQLRHVSAQRRGAERAYPHTGRTASGTIRDDLSASDLKTVTLVP